MSTRTIRNAVIGVVILTLSLAGFGFLYREILHTEAALQEQLAALAIVNERESTYFRLQKITEESKGDRGQLAQYFLQQSGDSITFLSQVEALAPKLGVTLDTLETQLSDGSDKKTKQRWIEVRFTFSGTRERVERFITVLEILPYMSHITNVNLFARAANDWEASVTMRVFLLRYDQ